MASRQRLNPMRIIALLTVVVACVVAAVAAESNWTTVTPRAGLSFFYKYAGFNFDLSQNSGLTGKEIHVVYTMVGLVVLVSILVFVPFLRFLALASAVVGLTLVVFGVAFITSITHPTYASGFGGDAQAKLAYFKNASPGLGAYLIVTAGTLCLLGSLCTLLSRRFTHPQYVVVNQSAVPTTGQQRA